MVVTPFKSPLTYKFPLVLFSPFRYPPPPKKTQIFCPVLSCSPPLADCTLVVLIHSCVSCRLEIRSKVEFFHLSAVDVFGMITLCWLSSVSGLCQLQ